MYQGFKVDLAKSSWISGSQPEVREKSQGVRKIQDIFNAEQYLLIKNSQEVDNFFLIFGNC